MDANVPQQSLFVFSRLNIAIGRSYYTKFIHANKDLNRKRKKHFNFFISNN